VGAGDEITYTITVANAGPDPAADVTLTEAIPAHTTFVSFMAPAGWTTTTPTAGGAGTITATAANLGATGPAAITLVVLVGPDAVSGSMCDFSAQVTSATSDPTAANNSAAVATTVATPPTNTAPTASDDTYTVTAGVALTVPARGVLSNDTDPEGSALAAVLESPPANGTLTLKPDGSFTYTPAAGFAGIDRFTYRASDGLLTSPPATVILNVAAGPPFGDTTGPTVTSFQRFGFHMQPTLLMLRFSEDLDLARATDVSNYHILSPGRDGRFGTDDDRTIKVASASYDPIAHVVTLRSARRLDIHRRFRLVVSGSGSKGVTDRAGNLLDGNRDLLSGGNFVVSITGASLAGPSVVRRAIRERVGATPIRR
jgi:uncharacterized repeat protein (TIGR01451 family)